MEITDQLMQAQKGISLGNDPRIRFSSMGRCPACSGTDSGKQLYQLPLFSVMRCTVCGLRFIDPALTAASQMAIYSDPKLLQQVNGHLEGYYGYDTLNTRSRTHRDYVSALEHLEKACRGRKLLEVGCGSGAFLKIAAHRGWDVTGIDSSPGNIGKLKDAAIPAVCADFFVYEPARRFDAVILWDLIEHPQDPAFLLRKCAACLNKDGVVLIATPQDPNLLSLLADFLHRVSFGCITAPLRQIYIMEHSSYFNRGTLARLALRCGLRLEAAWKTETDLARYKFKPLTGWVLRLLFLMARIFHQQNRLMAIARKADG